MTEEAKKLKQAYITTFTGATGQEVLNDLANFCRFFDSTYVPNDTHATIGNEFKRRVFLHIISHLGPEQFGEDFNARLKNINRANNLSVDIYE